MKSNAPQIEAGRNDDMHDFLILLNSLNGYDVWLDILFTCEHMLEQ